MKKELLEALKDMLADSFKVKTYTVFKNGKEVEAFLITEEDSAVSPTFYYKNYLDDYMKGVSVEDLAKEIVAAYFLHHNSIALMPLISETLMLKKQDCLQSCKCKRICRATFKYSPC